MPLRSVEAATRDDAIAAAREQFGPSARVVGVRRVRSGGVLGFFATERYVAEVAPDPLGAPSVPPAAPVRPAGALTEDPDTGSLAAFGSPLASAAPARARTAPSRNGAAAWAAEAARSGAVTAAPRREPALVGAVARSGAEDDARLDELAGLLGAAVAPSSRTAVETAAGTPADVVRPGVAPASFPRATRRAVVPAEDDDETGTDAPVASTTGSPSPFTAALARMVAGDRDVQHAVREALETTNQSAVWSRAAHQEEETVGDQVIAPPSTSVDEHIEPPSWADEAFRVDEAFPAEESSPAAVEPAPPVSREEAIAEVLRAALAEGHSDDALAGILRKVVAGDDPEAALDDPAPVLEPEETAVALVVPEEVAVEHVVVEEPVADEATAGERYLDLFAPVAPPVAVETAPAAPSADSALLWAEVVLPEPADVAAEVEEATAEVEAEEATTAEEATAEAVVEDTATDLEEPVLARTASDPAPVGRSLSMDATTVMPPLSLLPGSSSRGRGLPPVPPRTGRPPVPPSSRPAGTTSSGTAAPSTDAPGDAARSPEPLATVTRLPVAPLMPTPQTPEMPELTELADLIEADGPGLFDEPALPAVLPARPARVPIDPPSTPAEVLARLAALGVPADLLGAAFPTDVATDGTYAALTRALGRLPEAPELPTGAGDVLFVVGPGVETLRAARSLAATLRLDPDRVQWATRGDLVGLAPESSRMSTIDAALRRRQDAAGSGTVTIVAVDVPLRADAYWMAQMLAIWSPVAVWAVAEATRKPEDLEHWLDGLARVDALIVQDTDLSADPAAVLHRVAVPVAVVDGVRATPHRWASVLCERLESAPA